MVRCCLKCEKELIVGKTYTYTDDPEIYEVEIHILCSVCNRIERIKDEKKEMNKKVRELTKRQKSLEEIQNRRLRQYQLENEYLYFLKSQE
jgi:RNase P subunit RPR2